VFAYPMKCKSEAGQQLINLIQQVGISNAIHRDGTPEMGGNSEFNKDQVSLSPIHPGKINARILLG